MKSILGQVIKLGDKRQVYKKQCDIDFIPSAGMSFAITGNVLEVEDTHYNLINETLFIHFTPLVADDKFELEEMEESLVKSGFERTK